MNVLIACEESQAVCKEFRRLGHRAFSCDIQECSGGHPEWHIQGDALAVINGNCTFTTADGHTHTKWEVGSPHRSSTLHIPVECCHKASQLTLHNTGKDKLKDEQKN